MLHHRAGKANIGPYGSKRLVQPRITLMENGFGFPSCNLRIYEFDLICLKRDPRGTGCLN
jgi:hypothetical protein